jgi:hypothetical protein
MANPETANYETELLIGGPVKTRDDAPLAADTYYKGMPLAFVPTVTADAGNTGDGTVVVQGGKRQADDIIVYFTAALVFKLTVNSVDVRSDIALPDDGELLVSYNGMEFLVTDGATPWAADDFVTISASTGAYAYNVVNIENIYLGPDARVLGSAGQGSVIVEGEVMEGGIVDDSGDALTITTGMIRNAEANGIIIKNKATA